MNLLRTILALLLRAGQQFFRNHAQKNAAAISYYVLFSIIPLLIFIVGAAGLILGNDSQFRQDIVDEVTGEFPFSNPEGRQEVQDAVNGVHGTAGGAAGLVALAAAIWGASSMLGAIRYSLNNAFDDVEWKRPFVPQKAIDLALVFALAIAFIASIVVGGALRYAADSTKSLAGIGDFADEIGLLWDVISYLIPLVLGFVGFAAMYSLVPSRIRSPADVWPGALVAAILFETANIGFGIYLENFSSYNIVFGALGTVAVFLFWVYLVSNVMIFGAEVAAEYPRLRAEPAEQPAMGGLSEPLPTRAWGLIRSLFVRDAKTPVEDVRDKGPKVET